MDKLPKIADVVGKYLARSNINTPYLPYFVKIQQFLNWYRGRTDFHTYRRWNGVKKVNVERYSLDMAKTVCEDLASLIMNEALEIHMSDPESQKIIDETFAENNFRVNSSQLIELMFALGTGAFVSTWRDNKVIIDFIHGDMIFPINWDNGEISECAFAMIGGDNEETAYTILSYRKNENGLYYVEKAEVDVNGAIARVSQLGNALKGQDVEVEAWDTATDIPAFQVIKTNIVNNYDKTSPLGMSAFGNAIDILKAIDEAFDSLNNEFSLGKKRIFIKSGLKAIRFEDVDKFKDSIYNQVDSNDVVFYQIDWAGEHEDKPPIYESNMTLRIAEHEQGLNILLKMLSQKTGLGDNFYTFTGNGIARTATEVVSVHSALFRNMQKQELVISSALKGLCRTILNLYNINMGTAFDINQEITIDFDDSIIEDTEKKRANAMAEFNAGLIDQIQYFVDTRGYTRKQAIKFVNEMRASETMKQMPEIFSGGF